MLEGLADLCALPAFLADLYVNYDCNLSYSTLTRDLYTLHISLSIYLYINLFIYSTIYPTIVLSFFLSIYLSICLSVYLCDEFSICVNFDCNLSYLLPNPDCHTLIIYLSFSLSIYLSVCLCVYLCDEFSIHPLVTHDLSDRGVPRRPLRQLRLRPFVLHPIYLSIYLSIYPSIYLSIFLSVCLSLCLSM